MGMDAQQQQHQQQRRAGSWTWATTMGALTLVAVVALAACGSSDDDATTTTTTTKAASDATTTTTAAADAQGDLAGTFTSTEVTGHDLVAKSKLSLTLEDGQLSANAGCNTMGAAFTFDDGTLKWDGPARSTMMGCADDLMAQDTWITGLLTDGVKAKLDGDTLTLTADDVTIALERVKPSPLTGTTWTLAATIDGEAVSSLPADSDAKAPTLTIDEHGEASITTGCNSGGATVEVADATLTFGPMRLTRMACTSDAASALEAQVTKVLDGEVDYAIDGTSLTITNGSAGLTYQAS